MELMTAIWIAVIGLAVLHGLRGASRPREVVRQPRPEAPSGSPNGKDDDDLGAVEEIARIRNGVSWLPKGTRVWMSVHDDHD